MLDTLEDDGNFTWTCPHCNTPNAAHYSHEEVTTLRQAHVDDLIARGLSEASARQALASHSGKHIQLPPCECGTQTFLKADFTPEELRAPNMIDKQGNPTPSFFAANRHRQLLLQMQQAGKT